TGHVIKTVVIRRKLIDIRSDEGTVVQATSNTSIVTTASLKVCEEETHLFSIRVTKSVSIPRIDALMCLHFFKPLSSDKGLCCIFPLCLSWKTVCRDYNARFKRNS